MKFSWVWIPTMPWLAFHSGLGPLAKLLSATVSPSAKLNLISGPFLPFVHWRLMWLFTFGLSHFLTYPYGGLTIFFNYEVFQVQKYGETEKPNWHHIREWNVCVCSHDKKPALYWGMSDLKSSLKRNGILNTRVKGFT